MSATTFVRARNCGISGPSVPKLVKYFESLSANSSLYDPVARDGGAAGPAGVGKRGRVARPLQPRDDQKDARTRQQTPSVNRGSGDYNRGSCDCDRRNHLRNATDRGDLQVPSVVRFYDRRGIEYASPETRHQAYHHRRHGLRGDGDVTASASAARTTAPDDDRDAVVRVAVVVVVQAGREKPKTGAVAFDVRNDGTVPRRLQVDIELDD